MIVELAYTVRAQNKGSDKRTYQNTLFPAPATKGEANQHMRTYGLGSN
jgi:hypothetical protein